MDRQDVGVLGVSPRATPAELKRAFRTRAKAAHPDAGGTTSEFERLRAAFDLLQAEPAPPDSVRADASLDLELTLRLTADGFVAGGPRRIAFEPAPRRDGASHRAAGRTVEFNLPPDSPVGTRSAGPTGAGTAPMRAVRSSFSCSAARSLVQGSGARVELYVPLSLRAWLAGGTQQVLTPRGFRAVTLSPRHPLHIPTEMEGAGLRLPDGSVNACTVHWELLPPSAMPELWSALERDEASSSEHPLERARRTAALGMGLQMPT